MEVTFFFGTNKKRFFFTNVRTSFQHYYKNDVYIEIRVMFY